MNVRNPSSITLSGKEKLILFDNLGTMLSAGIPLSEALTSFAAEAEGNLHIVLEILKYDVNEGTTLASSFARLPSAFDPVVVSLLRAAEEAGTLDVTLKKELTKAIKRDMDFTDRIKAAALYPITVMVVFCVVLVLFLTVVVPRIAQVFQALRVTLPLPTKIIIVISQTFLANTILINGLLIVIAFLLWYFYKKKRNVLLGMISSLPIISSLVIKIDLARFTNTMSLLLSSGIPITEVLTLSEEVVAKKEMRAAINKTKEAVLSGKNVSDGIKLAKGMFPGIMVLMVEAGEKSGTLEQSLAELSEYFEAQVTSALKQISTLIEPILLVAVGVLVGGLMLSIIAPLYDLISHITPK